MTGRNHWVGQSLPRLEDEKFLRGGGTFVGDVRVSGMLEVAFVRSQLAHGRVLDIDATAALTVDGVRAVVTRERFKHRATQLPCPQATDATRQGLPSLLTDGTVRYVGEPVAAVVADSRYEAEDGSDAVQVAYQELPVMVDPREAGAESSPLLHPSLNSNIANEVLQDVGDTARALTSASHRLKFSLKLARQVAAPLEPRGILADYRGGRLTIWCNTQVPHVFRTLVASTIGMPENLIRVISPDVGGAFGSKCHLYVEDVIVCLLSIDLNRPVRWIEDRREAFYSSTHAREQFHEVEVGYDGSGRISALDIESITDNGAYLATVSLTPSSLAVAMAPGPYRVPNFHARSLAVYTNKVPLGIYRGAGQPQAVFVMESVIERVARSLKLDPAEVRFRNLLKPADLPYSPGTSLLITGGVLVPIEYDGGNYPEALRRALKMADYRGFRRAQAKARRRNTYIGIGLACLIEETGVGPFETATIRVDASGTIQLLTGSMPHGQGHVTAFAQIVADELQVAPSDVSVIYGDTDAVPAGGGSFASRSMAAGGAAARLAARAVREQALNIAAGIIERPVQDLVYRDAGVAVPSPSGGHLRLSDLARANSPRGRQPIQGIEPGLEGSALFKLPAITYAYASHVAKVTVTPEVGKVQVDDYVVVHDCGRLVNPLLVQGQIQGGVAQGIGGALLEELTYDASGMLLTDDLFSYRMPIASSVVEVRTGHLETLSPTNPDGIKGAGEGGTIGAPAAIANAVFDALSPFGVTINELPATPERITAAIRRSTRP